MCGIIGATGDRPALPILLAGLARLEYRGYDSAGVALQDGDALWSRRKAGKVAELVATVADSPPASVCGIGHTRWATHGRPATPTPTPTSTAPGASP